MDVNEFVFVVLLAFFGFLFALICWSIFISLAESYNKFRTPKWTHSYIVQPGHVPSTVATVSDEQTCVTTPYLRTYDETHKQLEKEKRNGGNKSKWGSRNDIDDSDSADVTTCLLSVHTRKGSKGH